MGTSGLMSGDGKRGGVSASAPALVLDSTTPAQGNPEAGEVEEGAVGGEQMFMANQQPAELTEPRVGAFDDPAAFVSSQLASVLVAPELAVLAIRNDEVDAPLLQPFAQRVGVVGAVGDHPFRLLSRTAFAAGDADLLKRGFRKRSFSRRGTFQPNSQRKTLTVDQYHPLRALATLGFTDCSAPFLAGAKLPSRKHSSHFSKPSPSSAPSSARHASSHTSCSSHCFNRRQQVGGEGNSSGRKRHAAPVCSIHRIPSKQARFAAHGRPRLSRRCFGWGSKGSISSHCASFNSSNRFLLIQEVHQNKTLMQRT